MLNVKVDRRDPTDLYEQVAGEIRRAIADGEAKPGERLPPAKDLAAVLDVNTNTVLRSLRLLRDEGLLEFRRGRGISVAGTPERGAVVQRATRARRLRPPARATASTSSSRSSKTSADEDRRRSRGAVRPRREQPRFLSPTTELSLSLTTSKRRTLVHSSLVQAGSFSRRAPVTAPVLSPVVRVRLGPFAVVVLTTCYWPSRALQRRPS